MIRHWTKEEDAKLIELRALGVKTEDMPLHIDRSYEAIKARTTFLKLPAKKPAPMTVRAVRRVQPDLCGNFYVPPEVIEERDRRMMAERDLTGLLCGDPPKGFSALERRA